jgi:exopolysaccharide biosynthesis polyprenyl glycosylphosphotransferase
VAAGDELFAIVKAVTFGMLIVMSAAFFYRAFSYSRIVFVLLWGSAILFLAAGRMIVRSAERSLYRSGRSLRNALIIGSGAAAGEIADALRRNPLLGHRLCGYVAAEPAVAGPGLPYLGTLEEVPAIVEREEAELALIALPASRHDELFRLVEACEGMEIEFLLVPDIVELAASTLTVKEIAGMPFIKIKGMPITAWGRILKRIFDLLVSAALLLVLSPVLLLAAACIKLDSPGPVFFSQERLGRGGKPFRMLKFRSMKAGAEAGDRAAGLGVDNDPRQTRVGTFLRRTSIDELPQLLNVFMGEMSLVGPRPERTYFVEQFRDDIPKYLDRHRMKTGMTGWAQVNGLRGNTSLEERVKFDLYYIENWSMAFDLQILLRTARAVFGRTGGERRVHEQLGQKA